MGWPSVSASWRAGALVLALALLGGCDQTTGRAIFLLEDIVAGPAPTHLKATTREPRREEQVFTVEGRQGLADTYHPAGRALGCLVLIGGFTPHGKNDPRIVELASSFARSRFLVIVPEVPAARDYQVSPEDIGVVADAARFALDLPDPACGRVGFAALSYAVGPTVMAALEPDLTPRVEHITSLGGYHDLEAVVTFATTGHYRETPDEPWQRRDPDHFMRWVFVESNLDLIEDEEDRRRLQAMADRRIEDPAAPIDDLAEGLGEEGRALLELLVNTDPGRVPALIESLPSAIQERMQALNPADRDLSSLQGRMILIHGREDDMIPYTESIAMAEAVSDVELHLIPDFSHIEPGDVGVRGQLAMVRAMRAVIARQRTPPTQ